MISIDKLHSYLNKNRNDSVDAVGNVMKDYTFKIPESKMGDGHIYGKYVIDGKFGFLGKDIIPVPVWTDLDAKYQLLVDKSTNKKNSFVVSILNQVMPDFRYFDSKSRVSFTKDMMRQIAYDMEEKFLYKEMEYTRLRNEIRKNFMNFEDIDNEEYMKKVFVDYLSLTVYVIKREEQEKFGTKRIVEKIAFVPGVWKKTDRSEEYTLKNPSCILVEQEGRYSSVIRRDLNGLFSWQDEGMQQLFEELSEESCRKIVKKSYKKQEDVFIKEGKLEVSEIVTKRVKTAVKKLEETDTEKKPEETIDDFPIITQTEEKKEKISIAKKITLAEIQQLAEKEGISITKKSDKTGKDLKKSIQELRDEIIKKYE